MLSGFLIIMIIALLFVSLIAMRLWRVASTLYILLSIALVLGAGYGILELWQHKRLGVVGWICIGTLALWLIDWLFRKIGGEGADDVWF